MALSLARRPLLRAYQRRVYHSLLSGVLRQRGVTFTVLFPRQSGKNEVSAELTAALLRLYAEDGGTIVVCAPTLTPQARISQERLLHSLRASDDLLAVRPASRTNDNVVSVGRASAIFLSASPAAHVAGHTASIALIADEAQDIDADWFNRQFRPMAASTAASTVMFGTPWDGATLLDEAVRANRVHDARAPDAVRRHHEVHWPEVAESVPAYGDYVRGERDRLGPNHPLFLSQYELRTIASAGRLLSPEQIAKLEGSYPRQRRPEEGVRYVAGLDLGGDGADADATVFTIGRVVDGACQVVEHVEWRGAPFERMSGECEKLARSWGIERLCVDATGLGGPLTATLVRALGTVVSPVVITAATKSELGYGLIAAVETNRLTMYADDGSPEARRVRLELRECEARPRAGTLLSWGNDRGHDDYVVSLALFLRAAESLGTRRLATGRRR